MVRVERGGGVNFQESSFNYIMKQNVKEMLKNDFIFDFNFYINFVYCLLFIIGFHEFSRPFQGRNAPR